tara:strand:+ start:792 stop:1721 length:930 start_codon:yes stop_codon:yes gene_type:complete
MKKLYFFLLFILIYFSNNEQLLAKLENNIVLKVENEIITKYEIKNKILSSLILSGQEINQENINKYKKSTLENLIQLKLMKIELSKYDLKDRPDKLNSYLKTLSSNNIDSLKKKFLDNKLDYNLFLDEIKIKLKWQDLIYLIYSKKIEIDDKTIDIELQGMIQNRSKIDQYKLSEIEILLNGNETDAENIKNISDQIKLEGFEAVAIKFSISESSNNKGELGWINGNILSKQIYDIVSNMKLGEVSKPIKQQTSVIFLKLNDKRSAKLEELDQLKLRKDLIIQKKNELFNLYSRSHLSKLKNTSLIEYR